MKVTLNEKQIEALSIALSTNPGDREDDSCAIEVHEVWTIVLAEGGVQSAGRQTHLCLDGAFLHSDGEFATWPEESGSGG